jgi:serine/threonine protein kinase
VANEETSEEGQREVLRQGGWIPLTGPALGEGGGARVFKAIKMAVVSRLMGPLMTPWNDRDVANKNSILLAELIGDAVAGRETVLAAGKVARRPDHRLKREIEILRDVQHPNLIRMLDHDKSDTPGWYVMPVMGGGTLHGRKDLVGDLAAVVQGMRQVALGLAALHARAIVHRDIKPKNIFVSDEGAWILGDPGVAYRDDDGDETTTRPVSKDWAPTWYGEELARTPKADLFMLGKTALSLLVGGEKPLDPSHVAKAKFKLPDLYPKASGVRELYALIRSLVVAEQDELQFADARELVPVLDELLPIVENKAEWRLQQQLSRLQRTPRTVFSYVLSGQNLVSGSIEGLTRVAVWIPEDCRRLVFWSRGHKSSHCGVDLHNDDGRELLAQLNMMENDAPSSMEVPPEARGRFVRMTITRQSGLLHNLLVYAES